MQKSNRISSLGAARRVNSKKEKNEEKLGFRSEIMSILEFQCRECSSDGGNWFAHINTKWIRVVFILFITLLQFVIFFVFFTGMLGSNNETITSTHFANKIRIDFPRITICNPRPFRKSSAEAYNISSSLATYMQWNTNPLLLLFLDDSVSRRLDDLESDFKRLEKQHAGDFKGLIANMTLSCPEIIAHCKLYGTQTVNSSLCCDVVFNKGSTFLTPQGACVTSTDQWKDADSTAGAFVALEVVINADANNTIDFDSQLVGFGKAASSGAFFVLHGDEDPTAALVSGARSVTAGTTVQISISTSKIDRTQFRSTGSRLLPSKAVSDSCIIDADSVFKLAKYLGFDNWSKANCNLMFLITAVRSCNMLENWGIEKRGDADLKEMFPEFPIFHGIPGNSCLPRDIRVGINSSAPAEKYIADYCFPPCEEIQYNLDQSQSQNAPMLLGGIHSKNLIIMEFFFGSQTQVEHSIRPRTFMDTFSDVGGLIGVICGASFISIIEYVYFYWLILRCCGKHACGKLFSRK